MIVVNYASHQSQCYVTLPFRDLAAGRWRLADRMSEIAYERDGADLSSRGLYLDLLPWQFHVFMVSLLPKSAAAAGAPERPGSKLRLSNAAPASARSERADPATGTHSTRKTMRLRKRRVTNAVADSDDSVEAVEGEGVIMEQVSEPRYASSRW